MIRKKRKQEQVVYFPPVLKHCFLCSSDLPFAHFWIARALGFTPGETRYPFFAFRFTTTFVPKIVFVSPAPIVYHLYFIGTLLYNLRVFKNVSIIRLVLLIKLVSFIFIFGFFIDKCFFPDSHWYEIIH